jgi:adenylate kinase family enzyme
MTAASSLGNRFPNPAEPPRPETGNGCGGRRPRPLTLPDVERVLILGPGGSGKSELSRTISSRTGLPVVHLDVLFWGPAWRAVPPGQALARLSAAVEGERWVLDGNFLQDVDVDGRLRRADTIVFLDLSRWLCLWRVTKRMLRDRRRRRADLPAGADESFDPDGMRWIWNYHRTDRPNVLRLLAGLGPDVAVHRLRTRAEVRQFVDQLPPEQGKQPSDAAPATPGDDR